MLTKCFRLMPSLFGFLFFLGLTGLSRAQQQPSADLLSTWLGVDCETGQEGVLEAQLAIAGAQLLPGLVQAAQNGPNSASLSQIQTNAGQTYDAVISYFTGLSAADQVTFKNQIQSFESTTRDEFVADQLSNAVFNYQSKALVGLGIIGGPTALQVLQSFANDIGSPLQPIAQQALANFAGPTTMAGNITSKAGPLNARVWTLALTNNGPAAAMGVQVNSVNLTQTFGAACTPVIASPGSFPLAVGSIAPTGSDSAAITINFTGCPASARFTANISFSANSGAVLGTVIRYNQFE